MRLTQLAVRSADGQPLERVAAPTSGTGHRAAARSRASSTSSRWSRRRRRWITDPLNPALAADPFGVNSVCAAFGYERPAWTHARIQPRAAGSARREAPRERGVRGRSVTYQALRARALSPLAALSAPDRPRRRRLPALRRPQDRPRQPDPSPRDRAADRGAVRSVGSPARSTPPTASMRGSWPSELLPRLGARAAAHRDARPRAASWARASARSRPSPPPGAIQGVFGRLLLQSGSFALHRHRPAPPRPGLRSGRAPS